MSPAEAIPADEEPFRLRRFVRLLEAHGELETVDAPVDLCDVAARLHGNPKAVLFGNLRGCEMELAGNVMGSRRRLALAFGVPERALLSEVVRRAGALLPPTRAGGKPPVQEVVWTGADADLLDEPAGERHVVVVAEPGDVGPDAKLLEPCAEAPTGLDYVISESTYGDAAPLGPIMELRADGNQNSLTAETATQSLVPPPGIDRGPSCCMTSKPTRPGLLFVHSTTFA